ncbi:MAG: hypothetical protein QXQ69_03125 [Candidatus Aenigmatarchaeota archaeon]
MPFVYVPLKTFPRSLEEAKKELEKLYECFKNFMSKDFDFISWFENDFGKDIKSLECISEKIFTITKEGKILGRLEYVRREAKKLQEERARLILGNYYSIYYSRAKEVFTAFYNLLDYLKDLFQLKT